MLTNNCSTEVDRAYENLQKSGKGYGMGGRRKFYGSFPTVLPGFPPGLGE